MSFHVIILSLKQSLFTHLTVNYDTENTFMKNKYLWLIGLTMCRLKQHVWLYDYQMLYHLAMWGVLAYNNSELIFSYNVSIGIQ